MDLPSRESFSLPADRHDVSLEVRPGNRSVHDAATFFAIAAGVFLGVGIVFLAGEAASKSPKLSDEDTTNGLVLSGVGVAGLAAAIPLLIHERDHGSLPVASAARFEENISETSGYTRRAQPLVRLSLAMYS